MNEAMEGDKVMEGLQALYGGWYKLLGILRMCMKGILGV